VAQAAQDPAVEEARDLYQRGTIKYAASDYIAALDLFTQAFECAAQIDDEEKRESVLVGLRYNLALAHTKAYEIDGDVGHLRRARDLFRKYLGTQADPEDAVDAKTRLEEVEATLQEFEERREDDTGEEDIFSMPSPTRDKPKTNGLVVGGIVLSSISAAGVGLLTGGLVIGNKAEQDYADGPTREERDDALAKGKRGNALAIAGGATAAVLLGAGIALIVVGKRRGPNKTAVAPAIGPESTGIALCGRF
jgi:hypothetical protein